MNRVLMALLGILGAVGLCVESVSGADFLVNSAADQVDISPGDGDCSVNGVPNTCSLRAAIQETNALDGADRILISAGTWSLSLAGQGEDFAAQGDLDISDDLEIIGAGGQQVTVDGNGLDRVFHVNNVQAASPAPTVSLTGISVVGGNATTADGYLGGGIFMDSGGSLTLTDVRLIGNSANQGGGVQVIGGEISIERCSFLDNTVVDAGITNRHGVGLYASSAQVDIEKTTFSGNAGIVNGSGAIHLHGCDSATISASTVAENSGSAIRSYNTNTELIQVTIADNGNQGISYGSYDGTDTLLVAGTVLSDNVGNNCSITSGIYTHSANVESGDSCGLDTGAGELINTDAMLGDLGYNGGLTETCEPLPGSPLIDLMAAADPYCQWEDQRGVRRPLDGNWDGIADCDVGSVESTLIFADGFESGLTEAWSNGV